MTRLSCYMRLLENHSEIVNYTEKDMPIRCVMSVQEDYPTLSVVNHWHNDLEYSLVTEGHMMYSVNGERIELSKGDAIFVNSARMHYGYWEEKEKCEFLCVVFGLEMLDAVPNHILAKLTGNSSPAYLKIEHKDIQTNVVRNGLKALYEVCSDRVLGYELKVLSLCSEIAYGTFTLFDRAAHTNPNDIKGLTAIHAMTGFIQGHYTEKLTLADIAAAGSVCRSRCCELFKIYTGKSPIDHLNEYRISKSMDMLKAADMNVTEIAERCGFHSSSYYAEVFRKMIGVSPTEFKQKRI